MRFRFVWPLAALWLPILACSTTTGEDHPGVTLDSGDLDTSVDDSGTDAPATDTPVPPGTTSTAVTLVVEPDDGEAKILDAIKNATKSVHCTMYLFSDNTARDALIAAKKAGKEVQVLLEKAPYPVTNANVTDFNTLKAAGVDVRWTTGLYQLTHAKYFVVDATTAYVMTLNFTSSGLSGNREYAAIDADADDVAQAEKVFAADFAGTAYAPSGGKLLLSPVDARARLTDLMESATTSLDMEMEELSDNTVETTLASVLLRGTVVRIVVPATGRSTDMTATLQRLVSRGAQVKTLSSPDVHAKTILVDGKRAYVGSVNLTTASLDKNREVGLVTETPAVLDRLKTTIDTDFAKGAGL